MEEDSIGLVQAVFQSIKEEERTDMHVLLKDISKKIGEEKAAQKVAGLGKLAWRKTLREDFFSPRKSISKLWTGDLRCAEVFLSIWRVDINQALRMSEDRQVEALKNPRYRRTGWTTRGQVEVGLSGVVFFRWQMSLSSVVLFRGHCARSCCCL